MFRAIEITRVILTVLIIAMALNGCFLHSAVGPGYAVDIKVSSDRLLKIADIKFIENIVTTEAFHGKRITPSDKRECVHFVKDTPQIQVGYCYDKTKTLSDGDGIKNFRLLISNDWKGQESSLKQEIDRLGDVFYKELADRFGKENVKLERRRTGPPF